MPKQACTGRQSAEVLKRLQTSLNPQEVCNLIFFVENTSYLWLRPRYSRSAMLK